MDCPPNVNNLRTVTKLNNVLTGSIKCPESNNFKAAPRYSCFLHRNDLIFGPFCSVKMQYRPNHSERTPRRTPGDGHTLATTVTMFEPYVDARIEPRRFHHLFVRFVCRNAPVSVFVYKFVFFLLGDANIYADV